MNVVDNAGTQGFDCVFQKAQRYCYLVRLAAEGESLEGLSDVNFLIGERDSFYLQKKHGRRNDSEIGPHRSVLEMVAGEKIVQYMP